jgi:hypothetical protein
MIAHAMTIIVNELNHHLTETYGINANHAPAGLRNISSQQYLPQPGAESATEECLNLTLVNIQQDSSDRNTNLPSRDTSGTIYQTPPLSLNLLILLTATHTSYSQALLMLGRAMRFFHVKPLFTESNVSHASLTQYAPENGLDKLNEFRFSFVLHSPTVEENQQLWATLQSAQVPSAWYKLGLLDLPPNAQKTKELPILERRMITNNDIKS